MRSAPIEFSDITLSGPAWECVTVSIRLNVLGDFCLIWRSSAITYTTAQSESRVPTTQTRGDQRGDGGVVLPRRHVDVCVHMCSPLHHRLPDTTQQHQTHHGYTYVHHLHTFLHTGSGLYNPLQHTRCVLRPHILYNLYSTLQHSTVYSSTAVLQSTTSTTPLS